MSCVASSTNLDQPAADPCPLLSINSSLKSQRPPSLPSSLLQPPLPPPPPPPPPLDERCSICMEDEDGNPTVRLSCKHVFHKQCLDAQVAAKSPSPRLTFGYLCCALCRAPMSRDVEIDGLADHFDLQDRVHTVCRLSAIEDSAISGLTSMPMVRAFEAVMREMAAYRCARCETVYCGGKASCAGNTDPNKLLCQDCTWRDAKSDHKCRVHGASKAIFKCDCCCSVATFDCSGNHYCDDCHGRVNDGGTSRPECRGRVTDKCPLSLFHPPNQPRNHDVAKNGFVIGCSSCLGIDSFCEQAAVSSQTSQRF